MRGTSRFVTFTLVVVAGSVLAGCATRKTATYDNEGFNESSTYSRSYTSTAIDACESARRALLSQGYVITKGSPDVVDGRKKFQQASEAHAEIEFHIVCAPDSADGTSSTVFVNAVQDRYTLKKTASSASLGVSLLGSVSMPFGASDDSMVKVGSETIAAPRFYNGFFGLLEQYLAPMQARAAAAAAQAALAAQAEQARAEAAASAAASAAAARTAAAATRTAAAQPALPPPAGAKPESTAAVTPVAATPTAATPASVTPASVAPATVTPAAVAPNAATPAVTTPADLKQDGVKPVEPAVAEAKAAEFKAAELKVAETRVAESKAAEPRTAEPKAADPQPGNASSTPALPATSPPPSTETQTQPSTAPAANGVPAN